MTSAANSQRYSYEGTRRGSNLALLVLANVLPIVGVLVLGWDVGALVVLYWAENLILGLFTMAKMLVAGGLAALLKVAFFAFHFGAFCAVHGVFISMLLLGIDDPASSNARWPLPFVFFEMLFAVMTGIVAVAPKAWLIGVAGLVISHGYSFFSNFIFGPERDRTSVSKLMTAPYGRIVILHIAVITGAIAADALGEPPVILLALIVLKIGVDIVLHLREHRRA
ncbi:MAG: DUF6498-containing protein [Pseudomonadota bacterium]